MEYGNSIIIIGPTGAGKTTLLNALLYLLRPDVRVVTVEDTRELNLLHEQWVALVTRESDTPGVRNVDMYELVKMSMRIRPDYLIIGELRGSESYVFFQALASGHTGLTTLHAGSVVSAIRRLIAKPMNVPKSLLPMANVFVSIRRVRLGDSVVRRVVEISEFIKLSKEGIVTNRVYLWNKKVDQMSRDRESVMLRRIVGLGLIDDVEPELARREALIGSMVKHGFGSPNTVFRIIRNYHTNPEETLKVVLDGEVP
jgi:flagellar protein FlaI